MDNIPDGAVLQIILTFASVITSGIVAYLVYLMQKRSRAKDVRDAQREREKERREEERDKEYQAIKDGICAVLRDHIIRTCMRCEKDGFAPVQVGESVAHMVNAYFVLGGNGVVKSVYNTFKDLPHVKAEEGGEGYGR